MQKKLVMLFVAIILAFVVLIGSIPDGSSLRTIRKEHPVTFSVPVGIRFSW